MNTGIIWYYVIHQPNMRMIWDKNYLVLIIDQYQYIIYISYIYFFIYDRKVLRNFQKPLIAYYQQSRQHGVVFYGRLLLGERGYGVRELE